VIAIVTVTASLQGFAQDFPPEQIKKGAGIYAQNCSPCHGARMLDPNAAFDLRKFPPDEKNRFVNSVTRGKNQMPPWGDLLQSDDIDALWAYIRAGER
jgi:mono/diheme cytochrome c family protein